jgi:kynurenine formamidase
MRHLARREHNRTSVEELADRYRTWGRWGPGDEVGAANYLTDEVVARAARLVRRGTRFPLALPLDRTGPQGNGASARVNCQHVMLRMPTDPLLDDGGLQRFTDDAVYLPLQCSTQWDAFCHAFYDGTTYNGHGYDSITAQHGALHNGVDHLGGRAVGRGVLLDLPRFVGRDWLEVGEAIQAVDLAACADAQGVEVGEGDFVLVRTGNLAQCRATGDWSDYIGGPAPGLGVSAAEFLCPRGVVAVATDTWGVEAKPYESPDIFAPLHVILLTAAGVYLGEMWDLEALAEDCAADGVYEFFLSAPPMAVTGAVGSPVTPIAIK